MNCSAHSLRDKSPIEFTNVVFDGVDADLFENDNFANIIFDNEAVALSQLLAENGSVFELGSN